jgi:hypothetical protein
MPQAGVGKSRTPTEEREFRAMLPNISLLYLGMSVLVLMDLSYLSRLCAYTGSINASGSSLCPLTPHSTLACPAQLDAVRGVAEHAHGDHAWACWVLAWPDALHCPLYPQCNVSACDGAIRTVAASFGAGGVGSVAAS